MAETETSAEKFAARVCLRTTLVLSTRTSGVAFSVFIAKVRKGESAKKKTHWGDGACHDVGHNSWGTPQIRFTPRIVILE